MKKIVVFGLILIFLFSFNACGRSGDSADSGGGEYDGSPAGDYIRAMEDIAAEGDAWENGGMPFQSEFYYRFAGSGISCLRLTIESVLWLSSEGEEFESLAEGSLYTDWDEIAGLSLASSYPWYFEGLLAEIRGDEDRALKLYANAFANPSFPQDWPGLMYLNDLSTDELYAMRESLRETEERIFGRMEDFAQAVAIPRDKYNFSGDYLRAHIYEALKEDDIEKAGLYTAAALNADPFSVDTFKAAVLYSIAAEKLFDAGAYLEEGLALEPGDSELGEMRDLIMQAAKEVAAQ